MVELPGIEADKQAWRAWARAERAALDMAVLSEAVVAGLSSWPPIKSVRTILTYLPMADEVNLGSLGEITAPGTLLATRTPEQGGSLSIHELGGPLEVHRLGFLQPHASAREVAPEEVDLMLVPGLAFDLWGTRLGRGAGYYDELIGRMSRRAVRVGVAPAALVVDRLPREEHDQPMAFLATEEGVVGVARSDGPGSR